MDDEHETAKRCPPAARFVSRLVRDFDDRYFEERFDIESGSLGYMASYTSGLSFVVQVRGRNSLSVGHALGALIVYLFCFELCMHEPCG